MNSESPTLVVDGSQVALLLVDDEPNILTALKRVFRPLGYQIHTAGSGVEGLRSMEEQAIDLVISDMRMPQMDGAAFLEQVANRWPSAVRILLTGQADQQATINAINKGKIFRYVSKPWEDNDLRLTVQSGLQQKFLEQERRRLERRIFRQNEELQEFNARLEQKVEQRTAEVAKAYEILKRNYTHTVEVFANLIELRKLPPAGHSSRVAEHARVLATRMGMAEPAVQDVTFAGILHDIGKLGLSDAILVKPLSVLSPNEMQAYREHPLTAERILTILDPLQEAGRLIRHHHERYDGSGFPDGLRGDAIPLGSRILAVVNDYDALRSGTLTGEAGSEDQARHYLVERRATHYDPNVVNKYLEVLDDEARDSSLAGWLEVSSAALEPGMKLARDLIANDGVLLLARGYLLDGKMVSKIRTLEKLLGYRLSISVLQG